jgi:hypothetical protein
MSKGSFKIHSVPIVGPRKQKTHPGVPEMGSGVFRTVVRYEAVYESVSELNAQPSPDQGWRHQR